MGEYMIETDDEPGTELVLRNVNEDFTVVGVVAEDGIVRKKDAPDGHRPAFSPGAYEILEEVSND